MKAFEAAVDPQTTAQVAEVEYLVGPPSDHPLAIRRIPGSTRIRIVEVLMVQPIRRAEVGGQLKISADRWRHMISAGVVREDEPLELLDGRICVMTPVGPRHNRWVTELAHLLGRQLSDEFRVQTQGPLSIDGASEPQPDVAVVKTKDLSDDHHPRSALLVVEVADTSLALDRTIKQQLYARARIPEYWIVNVAEKVVEVYRKPDRKAARYLSMEVLTISQVLHLAALPKVSIPVRSLFV